MAAFCREPSGGAYFWWRAPAWTGKSALMSWFVLNPPPGIRVVSFFVTARYAGQADWIAFTDVVLEQLAELLGEPKPPFLSEATRSGHLLRMLRVGAEDCKRQNQRLVLVVDGLDEDRGVTTGPEAHSIAAMLPEKPIANLRIIVAGRQILQFLRTYWLTIPYAILQLCGYWQARSGPKLSGPTCSGN